MIRVWEKKPDTKDVVDAINNTKGTDISSSTLYDVVKAVKNISISGASIDVTPIVNAINLGTNATRDLSSNFKELITDISTNSIQVTTALASNINTLISDISVNTFEVTSALASNINTLISDISVNTNQVTTALASNINTLISDISVNTFEVTSALASNINTLISDISVNTNQVTTLLTNNNTALLSALTNPLTVKFQSGQSDAFGRLRISDVTTLLDLTHTIGKNDLIECESLSTATTTYIPNASCIDMTLLGTTASSYAIRQSRKYTVYQPGKSLLVLLTGVLSTSPVANTINRMGYFDSSNGFFFEYNNGTVNIVKRSYVTGLVNDTKVARGSWNISNPIYYDFTKTNIYFFDFEWLGVGMVRCGIVHNGEYINLHDFYHDNMNTNVYMTNANLPIRYEIRGNGSTGTLRQICASVQSEGGYTPIGYGFSASRGTTAKAVPNTETPVISIKLKSGRIRTDVLPRQFSLFCSTVTNMIYRLRIYRSPNADPLTGSSWNDLNTESAVQYDINATGINIVGSYVIAQGYYAGAKSDITLRSVDSLFKDFLSLAADIDGKTDYIVLTCQNLQNNSDNVYASIDWSEFY